MKKMTRILRLCLALAGAGVVLAGCAATKGPVHVGAVTEDEAERRRVDAKRLIAEGYQREIDGRLYDATESFRKAQNAVDTVISPAQWYEARIKYIEVFIRWAPDSSGNAERLAELEGLLQSPDLAQHPNLIDLTKRVIAACRLTIAANQKNPDLFLIATNEFTEYSEKLRDDPNKRYYITSRMQLAKAYNQHGIKINHADPFLKSIVITKKLLNDYGGLNANITLNALNLSSIAKREAALRLRNLSMATEAVGEARTVNNAVTQLNAPYTWSLNQVQLGKALMVQAKLTPAPKEIYLEAQSVFDRSAAQLHQLGWRNLSRHIYAMSDSARRSKWLSDGPDSSKTDPKEQLETPID